MHVVCTQCKFATLVPHIDVRLYLYTTPNKKLSHVCFFSGVYPADSDNSKYVDFYYVGGGQNPGEKALAKGSLTFASFLPKGQYEYRYLYVSVFLL